MKTVAYVALCVLLITGCGKRTDSDLRAQVDDLTHRVKVLEDDLLNANKKLIQHQQAMQQLHEEMRNIENYFNKIQAGQSSVPR